MERKAASFGVFDSNETWREKWLSGFVPKIHNTSVLVKKKKAFINPTVEKFA